MATKKTATPEAAANHWEEDDSEWNTVEGEYGEIRNPDDAPVVGVYIGTREVTFEGDDGEDRLTRIYDFRDPGTGDQFSIWGSHDIDGKMANVEEGSLTRVSFVEEIPVAKGKRRMKRYRVQTR